MAASALEPVHSDPIQDLLTEKNWEELRKLSEFKPTAIGWEHGNVMSYPDVDGATTPVCICQFGGDNVRYQLDWFLVHGKNDPPVEFRSFTDEESEAMRYGMGVLRLPAPVVTHAVMNRKMGMAEMEAKFGRPADVMTEVPSLISLGRESLQGKTVLAAELQRRGETVVSLCGFSGDNLEDYSEALGDDPTNLTTEEAVEKMLLMVEAKSKVGKKEKRDWTAMKALDKLCEVFEKGNRPPLVICDMPGYRMPPEGEVGRMPNVFDFMTERSMAMINIVRMGDQSYDKTDRLDWRVIEDYCQQWELIKDQMYRIGLGIQYMFMDLVDSNDSDFSQDFAAWGVEYSILQVRMRAIYQVQEHTLVEDGRPIFVDLSMPARVEEMAE